MKFKESPYYNEGFLGKYLYRKITDDNEILTVQEFFRINDIQKEYHIKDKHEDHKLRIYSNYYELNCQKCKKNLYLVFDKPVYITGKYCHQIIAPEIVTEGSENDILSRCVTNKLIVNSDYTRYYQLNFSKVNNVYFHHWKVLFWNSEIENFFIFDEKLKFYNDSIFLDYYKIKFFGKSKDLKENILNNKNFKQGIIHIE